MSSETDTLLPQDDALDPQPGRAPERQSGAAHLRASPQPPAAPSPGAVMGKMGE
jgi:hypothetical protein